MCSRRSGPGLPTAPAASSVPPCPVRNSPPPGAKGVPEGRLHPAVACPVCKGDLVREDGQLSCGRCRVAYPIREGIPRLFPSGGGLTVDPSALHIKSRPEAAETLARHLRIEAGFIKRPRIFYGIYLLLLVAVGTRFVWGTAAVLLVLLVDWVVYRRRRGRVLKQFQDNQVALRTLADVEAVDYMYEAAGEPQSTMDDWVRLAWETTGDRVVPEDHWRPQMAERYLDIERLYRKSPVLPAVVVDVGTGDGLACWEFGIGRDSTFIGIEVSHLLLRQFQRHLPQQVALQTDGACLPLKDSSSDFLFCTEALEHFADPQKAVDEFLRVLRPGGTLVIQSPNAHRLRNLNFFEMLTLPVSLLTDRVLQKKVMHENTWHNACTYHWDFSVQDYRRMVAGRRARIVDLHSREFFWPRVLLGRSIERFRAKERFCRSIPVLKYAGLDLTMVVEKDAG